MHREKCVGILSRRRYDAQVGKRERECLWDKVMTGRAQTSSSDRPRSLDKEMLERRHWTNLGSFLLVSILCPSVMQRADSL